MEHLRGGLSAGFEAGVGRTTIVLSNQQGTANGYVGFFPRRSEWFHVPPAESLLGSLEWYSLLATHEGRHVAQLAEERRGSVLAAYVLLGELGEAALLLGLGAPSWFLEGDAVLTETLATESGRGRHPGFQRPLRAAALEDDLPTWRQAVFGSYRRGFVNPYELGYLLDRPHPPRLRPAGGRGDPARGGALGGRPRRLRAQRPAGDRPVHRRAVPHHPGGAGGKLASPGGGGPAHPGAAAAGGHGRRAAGRGGVPVPGRGAGRHGGAEGEPLPGAGARADRRGGAGAGAPPGPGPGRDVRAGGPGGVGPALPGPPLGQPHPHRPGGAAAVHGGGPPPHPRPGHAVPRRRRGRRQGGRGGGAPAAGLAAGRVRAGRRGGGGPPRGGRRPPAGARLVPGRAAAVRLRDLRGGQGAAGADPAGARAGRRGGPARGGLGGPPAAAPGAGEPGRPGRLGRLGPVRLRPRRADERLRPGSPARGRSGR